MAMADRLFPRFLPRLLGTTVLAATLAGAGAPAWSLDLLQAYQAAQEQDPRIRAARAARDAAAERLPQARAQLLPNLSASMGRNKNDVDLTQQTSLGESTTNDKYFSYNQALQLRQPLYRKPLWDGLRQAGFVVALCTVFSRSNKPMINTSEVSLNRAMKVLTMPGITSFRACGRITRPIVRQ